MSDLGIVSSSITLVEKSLALFRAINAAKNFGSSAAQSVMMLRFEAYRYTRWVRGNGHLLATLSSAAQAGQPPVALAANAVRASPSMAMHNALCDALAQIIEVLGKVDSLLSKYDRAFEPPQKNDSQKSVHEGLESVAKALSLDGPQNNISEAAGDFQQLKESFQSKTSFARRFKYSIQTWNEADQEILKIHTSTFKYWNDALIELVPLPKRDLLELEVSSQIVGPAEALDQLQNIERAALEGRYEYIRRSARVKIQRLNPQKEVITLEKKFDDLQINSNVTKSRRFLTEYRETGTEESPEFLQPQPVIVEWFYYDADWVEEHLVLANERVERLAHDLSTKEKPRHLPVLGCLGWVQHPQKKDRALLYSLPKHLRALSTMSPPVSLLEALTETRKNPTLADRFRLAAALAVGFLELHTVEWLHKAFNSQNILLLRNDDGTICYSKPFIVGFDFARPDKPGEISLSTRRAQFFELYRHPEIRTTWRPIDDSKSLF